MQDRSFLQDLTNLSGRFALVTGAAGHLGRVTTHTLVSLGATVIAVDLPSQHAKLKIHPRVIPFECDLEDASSRQSLFEYINTFARLDILINNAAFVGTSNLSGWSSPFHQQSTETWRRAIEVNLTAVFELCQKTAPILRHAQKPSILNIASIYGMCAPDWRLYANTTLANPAAYSASKAGLIQFTRWLSTTLAPEIRVNCISPGGIYRSQPENFIERFCSRVPLGRMASEDDLIGAITYLSTDMSSYVTGHNLVVDGGFSVW